jgi:sortase system peptidoglycan-associated protein
MKSKLIISALALSLFANTAIANDSAFGKYEEERVGTGLGMFIGAALGGPIGAVVAGYIGNKIGESQGEGDELAQMHDVVSQRDQQLAQVRAEQAQQQLLAKQRIVALEQQYVDRQIKYEQQMAAMHKRTAMEKLLAVTLQFRTGSSNIEPVYQHQLAELAKAIKNLQDYTLDLSGYADRQGEEQFNQTLSQNRADAVKTFMVNQGINGNRITTKAYGETQPLQAKQTSQADFFDRRVMLKLAPAVESVASNQPY